MLLSFATFSSMAAQRLCDAMLPELSRFFDVSLAQAAQVVSLFAVVYGVSQLFYGPLGDRLGKFRVVTWATLGCAVGNVLALVARQLDMLVLARMLVALGAAAIIPMSLAWIGDNVAYELRQETLARVGLGTTLGITGGQLLGGVFTDTVGWRWAFAFMMGLFLLVGVLLWRDGHQHRHQRAPVPDPTSAAQSTGPSHGRKVWGIITGRWSRVVLAVALLEGASGFGVLAIWASHLHQAQGLSLSASGAVVALFGLGGMFYMALARWMIPRLGEHGLARLGACLLGLSAGVVAYTPVWWASLPASLLGGFGFFMFHNTLQTNATQMAPASRGTGVSLFASFLFMGQSLGVLLAAALVVPLGSGHVIALGGAIMAVLGVAFSYGIEWRQAQLG